jgi:hypothetical protein
MRWEDERYIRLYTRDTVDWQALSMEAQFLLMALLRKVDRAGILPLGKHGKRGVAIAVGHVHRWVGCLDVALDELLADGCVALNEDELVFPSFITAQEAKQSDKVRQQRAREAARDKAAGGVTSEPETVTPRDDVSQNVTERHAPSREVTPGHAESLLAVPILALPSLKESVGLPPSAPPPRSRDVAAQADAARFIEWFNRRFNREFTANRDVVKLVGILLKHGHTEDDMRTVAIHLRDKWADDERMAQHLVPPTVLTLKNFATRLELGRQERAEKAGNGRRSEPPATLGNLLSLGGPR